jgi:mono/diheme cytochrome c family protein/small nuclear ribonucleoprotein (snRNP)-like protein
MGISRGEWAVVLLLVFPLSQSWAQESAPAASQETSTQQQEDPRGIRTREFLGLGRMPDARMAAEGAKIFGSTCGFCHGENARGASGPDLLRSPVVLDDNQGELIGQTVHEGRPAKGMPAFPSLTSEQLRDLAEYLHLQVELAANRGTYKALNVVTGNANAGEAYFNGAGKCNTCHSVTGDLAHIGSKMDPPDLQQRFLYPGPSQPSAPKVTVMLKDGTQISGTLKHLDDFYVSLDDAAGNYRSIALEKGVTVTVEDKLVFHRQMLDKYTNQQMHDLTAYLVTLK